MTKSPLPPYLSVSFAVIVVILLSYFLLTTPKPEYPHDNPRYDWTLICDVNVSDSNISVEGDMYVTKRDIAFYANATAAGVPLKFNLIVNAKGTYGWNSMSGEWQEIPYSTFLGIPGRNLTIGEFDNLTAREALEELEAWGGVECSMWGDPDYGVFEVPENEYIRPIEEI
jgi:hypothetical protein